MKLLLFTFTLAAMSLLLPVDAQAQSGAKPCTASFFFVASNSTRLHLALRTAGCMTQHECCDEQAEALRKDCEYRGEDGGTDYSSCRCQSMRYRRDCYDRTGYPYLYEIVTEINPECFGIQ